jgi:hypothetical protein
MNNNILPRSSSPKFISQSDFIYFKNELLKDLKTIEANILSKVKTTTDQYDTKLLNIDSKLNMSRTKIFELSASISSDKSQIERINKLFVFKLNAEDKISSHDKRIKELGDYLNESIYSMNKTLQENINYPGVIGINSKFANFHAFVDFVINNINGINAFKEKMAALDMQNYKTKLDKIMKSYKAQIDTFISSSKNLATETLVIFDNKVNELLKASEEKIEKERNNLKKDMEELIEKYEEINKNINGIKDDFVSKMGNHDDEFEKKFMGLNLKYDKYMYDIDELNKKLEETNGNIKKICIEYEDKIKEQELKILSKINYLISLINNNSNSNSKPGKKNYTENSFKKILDKEFLSNFKSPESSIPLKDFKEFKDIKETVPVESRLKKYIEGEISVNEILSNRDRKNFKRQNSSNGSNNNDTERRNKLNKFLDGDVIPYINNVKFIKFQNEAIKSNQDVSDNKLFMNRKKVDSYIIEKENIILNKVPRKQIIKNLLQGTSEPISYYLKKNKEEKKSMISKMLSNQKKTLPTQKKIDINASFKKRFHNSTSQFFKPRKLDDGINSLDKDDLEDLPEDNKRTYSSGNSKTRNNDQNSMRQNSIMGFNTTDILKDNNDSKNEEDEKNNNNNENKNEIFIQDDNKEKEYQKKKTKIIHNFNSASKLFDINMKSESLFNTKYKLNPLHKNIKIVKKAGSPVNQTFNSKYDKEKNQRNGIHYYFNIRNKK